MVKIDRYSGYVIDGAGRLTDHLKCKDVLVFDFPMGDCDVAKDCLELCLTYLNNEDLDGDDSVKVLKENDEVLNKLIKVWREIMYGQDVRIYRLQNENALLKKKIKGLED